jgi:hypothetical protein
MRALLRLVLVAAAPLLLAGCYVSKQPLITSETADYPIAAPAHFDAFLPRGKEWRPQPGRTLQRAGAHYVYVEDGSTKRSAPFLVKRIGPKRYIVQLSDSSDPKRVTEFYYTLMDFDGTTAVEYQPACAPRESWVTAKWIDKVERLSTNDRCLFTSFDNLKKVLEEAAIKAAPEARFVLSKPK